MKNILRHLGSFIAPLIMCFMLPYWIIVSEQKSIPHLTVLTLIGALIAVTGLVIVIAMIRTFILIGNGTIMPWDPTRKLIVAGLYGYVRNPMILGVFITQFGEALLFASWGIALLAGLFFMVNNYYFIYSEEPGLERRFGQEYLEYKQKVPRWIPRLKPWHPH